MHARLAVPLALIPLLVLGQAQPAAASTALTGTFTISRGDCGSATPAGSYFRMILHNGTTSGPFLSNSDSPCRDQSYTPLAPGSDGGLRTGRYQSEPGPAFDSSGNGRAAAITAPTRFFGVNFATATNSVDPQTSTAVGTPTLRRTGTSLAGDLRGFAVSWNNQHFNQGSPRPDGSTSGNTRAVSGTIDVGSGRYTLQWTSEIHGGPFDGFTGLWHLTGSFRPSSAPALTTSAPTSTAGHSSTASAGPVASASTAGVPGTARTPGTTPPTGAAAAAPPATAPSSPAPPADLAAAGGDPPPASATDRPGGRGALIAAAGTLLLAVAVAIGALRRRRAL